MSWRPQRASRRATGAILASLVLTGALTLAIGAAPRGNGVRPPAGEPLTLKLLDRIETKMGQQLFESGIKIQQGADPDVVEGGYTAAYHGQNDPWNDILQVSRLDNPLITEACRTKALERALNNATDRELVTDHLRDQVDFWNELRQGARQHRLSEVLLHLAECHAGCAPYMSGILSCHVEGVRSHPRAIVYFGVGRPQSNEERYFVFSRADEQRITELARQALEADRRILLISRASILNAYDRHNISGNNAIAWRRARVVDRLLIDHGFPRDRIQWKILAWEMPRLVASDVAAAYGFLDDWNSMPNKQYMDQSVVLVTF